jgi:omega-amidase
MIKDKLNLLLVQFDMVWENRDLNLTNLNTLLSEIKDVDLVILPEMFSTGFTMNTSLAEPMDGVTVNWMKQMAFSGNYAIAGSIIVLEHDKFFNRMIWCQPDGNIFTYDKKHLFRMGEEGQYFTPGNQITTIEYLGWKIRPFICYDLRFPVWSRNKHNEYDIMINVANWPAARRDVFTTLLKARAIENQCYVAGVNRTGKDGNGIAYAGDSVVFDPKGKCLLQPLPGEERTESIFLDYNELVKFREKFPVWKDMDDFTIGSF